MSLASRLPYDHPYAGGYPGLSSQALPTDADALDYLSRMATADGAGVETGVAVAVDAFYRDAKELGVFSAIRASCLLAGARTLAGALVPLKNEGPELVDIDNLPTPGISDFDGSSGSWDVDTRTVSNTAQTATNTSFPRFSFAISGIEVGKTYRVSARFSGDFDAVGSLRLASSGGPLITDDDNDGVFEGTVTATAALLQIVVNGNLPAPVSATIESLSIREVIAEPTNVADGFVEGDYSRTAGLTGDGATTYLDSGRANNADPQNDNHNAVYATAIAVTNGVFIASGNADHLAAGTNVLAGGTSNNVFGRNRSAAGTDTGSLPAAGFIAANRNASGEYVVRNGESETTASVASETPTSDNILLFRRGSGSFAYGAHTLAFYSIGTSLSLADLDTAVTNLITAIGEAL